MSAPAARSVRGLEGWFIAGTLAYAWIMAGYAVILYAKLRRGES